MKDDLGTWGAGENQLSGERAWLRWLTGRSARPETIEELCRWQRSTSPIRTLLYTVVAIAWCALLAGPTSVVEFAGPPLLLCMIVRILVTLRVARYAVLQPAWVLSALYAGWVALSLWWTPDPRQGFDELGTLRWWYVIPAIWPVLDRRRALIHAMMCGFLLGNIAQLAHWIGVRFDVEALAFARHADRISGWWDPVVGGTLLVGALGLAWRRSLVFGRGRERALGGAGAGVTALAIVATGTRGAWLAGASLAVVVVVAGVVSASRQGQGPVAGGSSRRRALIVAGLAMVGVVAWGALCADVAGRFRRAVEDVREAVSTGNYATDTGARLLMARWALREFASAPVRGVGAGGFRAYVKARAPDDGEIVHDHAHNALLHSAATLGGVGVLLGAGAVGVALACGVREGRAAGGGAALGPACALAGLCLVGMFDTVQVNAQTAALLCTLVALCPARLPRGDGA